MRFRFLFTALVYLSADVLFYTGASIAIAPTTGFDRSEVVRAYMLMAQGATFRPMALKAALLTRHRLPPRWGLVGYRL